jgi:hypothetical protein
MTKTKLTTEEINRRRKLVFAICDGRTRLPNPDQPLLFGGRDGDDEGDRPECVDTICTEGYAEPGYDDNEIAVVTGNWNVGPDKEWVPSEFVDPNHEDTEEGEVLTTGRALELLGVELEWSDEWTTCCDCNKLVRTQPNSYSWKRSYWDSDNGAVCEECLKKDPADYIEEMVGNDRSCITIDIDLSEHGFVKLEGDLESGFHEGQAADPKVIGKNLRKHGIERYVYVLDSTGQFDLSFSVWVDKDELEASDLSPEDGLLPSEMNAEVSPAEQCRKYLQDTSRAISELPPGEGVVVTKPDPNDPSKAKAKRVSKEDFIAGKALDD